MSMQSMLARIRAWTTVAPLLAAVFAPFSVLFDIPALTEPWFIRADPNVLLDPNSANAVPDHPANLALSAIGLAFNVFANALLLVRFSTSAKWWRIATRMSVVFWISKGVIALVNLCVFGSLPPDAKRGEGLWCAVVSLAISGLITALLLCHWAFDFSRSRREKGPDSAQLAVRVAGRHFMLNVTFFVIDLGVLALIASQVENWTYLQGIYFTTVTYLTVGFGDFYPTHTITRILLFFFAVVGIAQLGNIVGMLVEFFRSRSAELRVESRKEYERRRQEESRIKVDLRKEMDFLHHQGEREEQRMRIIQLMVSLAGLLVFWVVGAAIFSQLEGWTYGIGLYFAYVSFLTVGYGDFVPITAAGRVVFVLYAIIAVPIMASFAVQAVQQVFSAFSAKQYDKRKEQSGLEQGVKQLHGSTQEHDMIVPHAEFVEKWHRDWEEQVRTHETEGSSDREARELAGRDQEMLDRTEFGTNTSEAAQEREQQREFDEDARLVEQILEYALSLEWRARRLLIAHLDSGTSGHTEVRMAQIMLKADRNVQLLEVKGLLKEIEDSRRDRPDLAPETTGDVSYPALRGTRRTTIIRHILRDDPDALDFLAQADEHETLGEVKRYREDFAGLLAAGSRLMGLKGTEQALFERRRLRRE